MPSPGEILLSKTNYILYRDCPKNAWLKIHKPSVYFASELSDFEKSLIETGNEVEAVARELYPTGVLIEGRDKEAQNLTRKLIAEGEKVLFQPVFEKDGFLAAVDILKKEESGKYSILEIKATNDVDEKTHVYDLAFQYVLLRLCGLEVEKTCIVHLNPEYVRDGEIDLSKLFLIQDITEKIASVSRQVFEEMDLALHYLRQKTEPAGFCICIYKGRSRHCTTFKYSNPGIPEYGIHDLSRIGLSKNKLTELMDGFVYSFQDIPEHVELSDIQKNQIWTYINNQTLVDREKIKEELEPLIFPLYFLDYETFPSALPRFDGYSPYQQIPFQYSLHVLESPDAEPKHFDFLFTDNSDPSQEFVESLMNHIGPAGSVIVWHKSFECGRNKELAQRVPASKSFFANLEARIYDLEEIFKKQYHVHKDYKGSSSIKKVLPVLVPDLSYKDMGVGDGGAAAETWNRIVRGELIEDQKQSAIHNLREYCKLDTYAMYAIWKELYKLAL